jgi:hypothetical protein
MIQPLIGHGPQPEEVHTFTVHFFINLIEILLNDLVTTIQDTTFSCFRQSFQENVCVCVCIYYYYYYIYTHIHIYKYIHIHTHIHIYTHIHI